MILSSASVMTVRHVSAELLSGNKR